MAETNYVVILITPVEEDLRDIIALQLADKLNVSISKMTKLLSSRPGPLTKAVPKATADKLANVLRQLNVNVTVLPENLNESDTFLDAPETSDDSSEKASSNNEPKLPQVATQAEAKETAHAKQNVVAEPEDPPQASGDVDLSIKIEELVPPLTAKEDSEPLISTASNESLKALEQERLRAEQASKRTPSQLPMLLLALLAVAGVAVFGASYIIPQARGVVRQNSTEIQDPLKAEIAQRDETPPKVIEEAPVEAPLPNSTNTSLADIPTVETASFASLEEAAQTNDPNAQFDLAWAYANGSDVEQSYENAATWLEKAAAQNHAQAQYLLGLYYFAGHGVAQNDAEAISQLEKAATQGVSEAQLLLGKLYISGDKVEQNNETAKKWLYLADEQGLEEASTLLASLNPISEASIFDLAQEAKIELLKQAVEGGANLNERDAFGQTPLMYAVSAGVTNELSTLVDLGADINAQTDSGWTALMYAARDNPDALQVLLEHEANMELVNSEGSNAYEIAEINHPDLLTVFQTSETVEEANQ